jgi:hypothetical protein
MCHTRGIYQIDRLRRYVISLQLDLYVLSYWHYSLYHKLLIFWFRHVEFRKLRALAEKLRLEIPHEAWNNSKYEYVFWREIPDSTIVDEIDDFEGV